MYDSGKVIVGLVIFVAIATFPFWFGMGKAAPMPKPEILTKGQKQKCVESREFMRSSHMQLLNQWRDWALRDGKRLYENERGEKIYISLQNTCMKCHSNKDKFCDKCHEYASIKPYCWDCHYVPKESKKWN